MDRGKRTLIVVGLAVVMAGVATFGVYQAIRGIKERQVPVRPTVVAKAKTPKGTFLSDKYVKIVYLKVSEQSDPAPEKNGFFRIEEVLGRATAVPLEADEPVSESKLAPNEASGRLSMSITPGMRAMSVRVNEVINVAGYVVPGSHVDVVLTERPGADTASKVILTNIKVLQAGTKTDQQTIDDRREAIAKDVNNKDKYQDKPIVSTVVTLLVTPEDAEKLALAQNDGNITLALRNPYDAGVVPTNGTTMTQLVGPTKRPAAGPPPSIEAIRGTTKSKQEIVK
jgi:pilus assembly protein CpaB